MAVDMEFGVTLVLVTLLWARITSSEVNEKLCQFQDTCEQCLGANYQCSWCTDKLYERQERCLTRDELISNGCNSSSIWVNDQQTSIVEEAELRDYQTETSRAIQVTPQKIRMKLVKGHTQQIKLTYRPAQNNPLDLYYLMDLTWTMRDDKETLVKLGAQLSQALQNLTGNYRIGFGSFADKPAMPMIMPSTLENPCSTVRQVCEPTYGFRHHLPLTDDIDNFVRSVNASRVTGNLDNMEGGIDALMQVIVCPNVIGWKDEARKIVLLVTDGYMHFAGDGILAGINLRNDRKCHLDETGEYTASLDFDYPSLEEIYRELLERKVSVIFAVTSDVVKTYKQMSRVMNGISNVEILSSDSSNILELIKTSYETFLKRAKFIDDSPPFIRLSYETNCGNDSTPLSQRNYCNDLKMGKEVEFHINVTLDRFPDDGTYERTIRIEESGLSEYLELEIEIQRPCPCDENVIDDEYGRQACSDHGSLQCGMCRCEDGWGGLACACDLANGTTTDNILKECQQRFTNPVELGPICSNRGICDCGTCYCYPGYAGKYCECLQCDDCDPERAECICGLCVCKYGWVGNNCNRKDTIESCKSPSGEICSDRGKCQFGECECEKEYAGRYCEIGVSNENKLCVFYEPCVRCLIQQKVGTFYCENITEFCSNSGNEMFEYSFIAEDIGPENRCLLRLVDDNDEKCDHFYWYSKEGASSSYLTIKVTDCTPVDYIMMGGFISLFTFLIGLVSIGLFICYTRLADAAEYSKFEEQRKFATLMESPIYRDPITRYNVPKLDEDDNEIE